MCCGLHEVCPAGWAAEPFPLSRFSSFSITFPDFSDQPHSLPAIMAARGALRERAPPLPRPAAVANGRAARR